MVPQTEVGQAGRDVVLRPDDCHPLRFGHSRTEIQFVSAVGPDQAFIAWGGLSSRHQGPWSVLVNGKPAANPGVSWAVSPGDFLQFLLNGKAVAAFRIEIKDGGQDQDQLVLSAAA